MRLLLSVLALIVIISSCGPELVSERFSPFYELTVNGSKNFVEACGTSDHMAKYLKDTAVLTDFGCGDQGAGFYLKGYITDGQYQLDHRNQAWYEEGGLRYSTDSLHQGSLTIRTVANASSGYSIYFIEGEISFNAIERNSGKTISVVKGRYVLKKQQY
jgi:hypothetical protein